MNQLPHLQRWFNVLIIFLVLAVIANLIWLNLQVSRASTDPTLPITQQLEQMIKLELAKVAGERPSAATVTTDLCDADCVRKIVDEQLSIPTPTPTNFQPVVSDPQPTVAPKSTVSFFNLASGGASATSWTPVAGSEFWLDTSLYGENVSTTWEGRLAIKDGNGIGYVHLYDMTNNRAVDNSQASVSNGDTISFYSIPLVIWRGQNQYRIEVYSTTGYEVSVSSPRLKLVSN